MSSKIVRLREAKIVRNATSRSKGRRENAAYRVREHLTEAEMDKLLAALKRNRHGRDWLIGLITYRHGLRVSEACESGKSTIARSALSQPSDARRKIENTFANDV